MREKMARALASRHFRRAHMADANAMPEFAGLADAYAERSWGGFMGDAVSILDVMDEPTAGMLAAAGELLIEDGEGHDLGEVWSVMVAFAKVER